MIVVIQGTPGSGKSYEATVYHALRSVQRGRRVITNLPLNIDEFIKIDPAYEDLIEIREDNDPEAPQFSIIEHYETHWTGQDPKTGKEMGPIFIIDECHRAVGGHVDKEVADWFATHRHRGVDVVLLTQNHSDIARTITNRVDHLVEVENLKRKGMGRLYMRRVYSDCGFRPRLEGQMSRTYNPQYFGLYNSYTQGGSGLEIGSSDIRPWYREPRLMGVALVLVCSLGVALYGTYRMIVNGGTPLSGKVRTAEAKHVASAPDKVAPASSQQSAAPARARVSSALVINGIEDLSTLHYYGVVSGGEGNTFLFHGDDGNVMAYSSSDLQEAGVYVTSVGYCRIRVKRGSITTIIGCSE